jgi:hypothetical protein
VRYCDCLLHHHLGRGNTQHLPVGIQAPRSGHRHCPHPSGGPSALHFEHTARAAPFLSKTKLEGRTVRPRGPDRPPLCFATQHRTTTVLSKTEKSGPNRPPSWAGTSAVIFLRATQKPKVSVQVLSRRGRSSALWAGLSALAFSSHFFKLSPHFHMVLLALMHASYV